MSQTLIKEEPLVFDPFMSLEEVYKDINPGQMSSRFLASFNSILGLPRVLVSSKFQTLMNEILKEDYPALRCSAARAIMEGRIPGIPKPIETVQPGWRLQLAQGLALMDLFETILYRYVQEQIQECSTKTRGEVNSLSRAVGTAKLPRLMTSLLEDEKK